MRHTSKHNQAYRNKQCESMQGTTQAYKIWQYEWCNAQIKRERKLRVNRSNTNNKMYFEVRAPSSTSPPSPRRISNPLTSPPRTPNEGTSTEEDFYNKGVSNSSLNQQHLHRGNTTRSTEDRSTELHQYNLYRRGPTNTKEGFTTWWYISTTNTNPFPTNK